jgi:hypothetical protein
VAGGGEAGMVAADQTRIVVHPVGVIARNTVFISLWSGRILMEGILPWPHEASTLCSS